MEWSKGHQELDCCLAMCYVELIRQKSVPLVGCPTLLFIDQGGAGVTDGRKRKKTKVEKVLQVSRVFLFPCACPTNMADQFRDGMFADPYRAVPGFYQQVGVSHPMSADGAVHQRAKL